MSLNWYILNKETIEFYGLGGAGWYDFELEAFKDYEYLEEHIFGDIFDGYTYPTFRDGSDKRQFIKDVCNRLIAFVGNAKPENIMLFSEAGDDKALVKSMGYICVGDIYGSDGLEDNIKPSQKHIYRLIYCKNYEYLDLYKKYKPYYLEVNGPPRILAEMSDEAYDDILVHEISWLEDNKNERLNKLWKKQKQ
jgi:hypothetical protein